MDPVYYTSVLDPSLRQATQRDWPRPPYEREMVAWSPDRHRAGRSLLTMARAVIRALLGGPRVAPPDPTLAAANDTPTVA